MSKNKTPISTVAEIRARREPIPVTLPSLGVTVMVRAANLTDLAMSGRIPLQLVQAVEDLAAGGRAEAGKITTEDLTNIIETVDAVCMAAIVDPPVALEGDENTLSIRDDIPWDDRQYLFTLLRQPFERLRSFRPEQPGDDHPAPDSDDLQSAA